MMNIEEMNRRLTEAEADIAVILGRLEPEMKKAVSKWAADRRYRLRKQTVQEQRQAETAEQLRSEAA